MTRPTHHRSLRRLATPLVLVGLGVMLLMGCIWVPTSRQYQPSGQPRPESLIGSANSSKPVRLNKTRIDEALQIFQSGVWKYAGATPIDADPRFVVSPEKREIGIVFSVVTGRFVGICGGDTNEELRMLVVDFDADGYITGYRTFANRAGLKAFRPFQSDDLDRLFGPERARALQEAGVFSTQEWREIHQNRFSGRNSRGAASPAASAPTTQASTSPSPR